MPIQQVYERKANGQKLVTVPADADIEPGDYVRITKVEDDAEED